MAEDRLEKVVKEAGGMLGAGIFMQLNQQYPDDMKSQDFRDQLADKIESSGVKGLKLINLINDTAYKIKDEMQNATSSPTIEQNNVAITKSSSQISLEEVLQKRAKSMANGLLSSLNSQYPDEMKSSEFRNKLAQKVDDFCEKNNVSTLQLINVINDKVYEIKDEAQKTTELQVVEQSPTIEQTFTVSVDIPQTNAVQQPQETPQSTHSENNTQIGILEEVIRNFHGENTDAILQSLNNNHPEFMASSEQCKLLAENLLSLYMANPEINQTDSLDIINEEISKIKESSEKSSKKTTTIEPDDKMLVFLEPILGKAYAMEVTTYLVNNHQELANADTANDFKDKFIDTVSKVPEDKHHYIAEAVVKLTAIRNYVDKTEMYFNHKEAYQNFDNILHTVEDFHKIGEYVRDVIHDNSNNLTQGYDKQLQVYNSPLNSVKGICFNDGKEKVDSDVKLAKEALYTLVNSCGGEENIKNIHTAIEYLTEQKEPLAKFDEADAKKFFAWEAEHAQQYEFQSFLHDVMGSKIGKVMAKYIVDTMPENISAQEKGNICKMYTDAIMSYPPEERASAANTFLKIHIMSDTVENKIEQAEKMFWQNPEDSMDKYGTDNVEEAKKEYMKELSLDVTPETKSLYTDSQRIVRVVSTLMRRANQYQNALNTLKEKLNAGENSSGMLEESITNSQMFQTPYGICKNEMEKQKYKEDIDYFKDDVNTDNKEEISMHSQMSMLIKTTNVSQVLNYLKSEPERIEITADIMYNIHKICPEYRNLREEERLKITEMVDTYPGLAAKVMLNMLEHDEKAHNAAEMRKAFENPKLIDAHMKEEDEQKNYYSSLRKTLHEAAIKAPEHETTRGGKFSIVNEGR